MTNNAVIDLILLIFPALSMSTATILSYAITFLIGLGIGVPAVLLWIRKNLPTIIAFLMYIYKETEKAESMKVEDSKGVLLPMPGPEKYETVMSTLTKEMLNPENKVVTKKNLSLFKKIVGGAKSIGSVIEFVLPIAKLISKRKQK